RAASEENEGRGFIPCSWRLRWSAAAPEVGIDLAGGLRRHAVGGQLAADQLERDAERLPAGPRPAREPALAPVVAHRARVEPVDRLLGPAVADLPDEADVEPAVGLRRVRARRQERRPVQAQTYCRVRYLLYGQRQLL